MSLGKPRAALQLTDATNDSHFSAILVLVSSGDPLATHSRRHTPNLDKHVSRGEREHGEYHTKRPSPAREDNRAEVFVRKMRCQPANNDDRGDVDHHSIVRWGAIGNWDNSVIGELFGECNGIKRAERLVLIQAG